MIFKAKYYQILYSKLYNTNIIYYVRLIEDKKASQELIIKLLERKGLLRIYSLMTSADPSNNLNISRQLYKYFLVMRRFAVKLLIELAYRNEKTQIILCEAFSFTPIKGQVALNPIP